MCKPLVPSQSQLEPIASRRRSAPTSLTNTASWTMEMAKIISTSRSLKEEESILYLQFFPIYVHCFTILTSNVLRQFGDGTILLLTLVNPLSLFRRKTYNIKKKRFGGFNLKHI